MVNDQQVIDADVQNMDLSDPNNQMVAMSEWLIENEHLKGTSEFNQIGDGLKALAAEDVGNKYRNIFAEKADESGSAEDFATAFGVNALEVGAGMNQMALEGAVKLGIPGSDELLSDFTRTMTGLTGELQETTTDSPIASFIGDVGSDIAVVLTSPSPVGKGEAAKGLAKKIIESGIEMGALEGVKLLDENGNRLSVAATAAAIGGLSRGAFDKLASSFNEIVGAKSSEVSKEIGDLADKFKVGVTVGELRQSRPVMAIENLLERLPFGGIGDFVQKQGESLQEASERLVKSFGRDEDEVGSFLQGKIKESFNKVRAVSDENYAKAGKAFKGEVVEFDEYNNALMLALDDISANADLKGMGSLVREIKRMLPEDALGVDEAGEFINKTGKGTRGKDYQNTYKQIKLLKKLKGSAIDKGDRVQSELYTDLINALDNDLDSLASTMGGQAKKLHDDALAFYHKEVVPYTKGKFDKARTKTDVSDFDNDMLFGHFIKKGDRSNIAKALAGKVDLDAKEVIKRKTLSDAYESAGGVVGAPGGFSAAKFSKNLKDMSKARDVFFTKAENDQVDGLIRLIDAMPTAASKVTGAVKQGMMPTIARVSGTVAPSAAGLALGGVSGAMVTIGGIKGLSLLLTSKVGRRLLTQANNAKNKKGMAGLSPQINAEIARITKAMVDTGKERAVPVIALPESDDR